MLRIFSPLPPSKSGIANYTKRLLPQFAKLASEVEVVCSSEREIPSDLPPGVQCISFDRYLREVQRPAAAEIFQQGNNPYHTYVYGEFARKSGIIVLHDICLHHLLTSLTLAEGDVGGYVELLEDELRDLGRYFAYQRTKGHYSRRLEFMIPLVDHVVRRAKVVVVHSRWGKMYLDSLGLEVPVHYVPHFATFPEDVGLSGVTREQARRQLKLPQDEFLIVAPGFASPPKKIEWLISALELLGDSHRFRLVIAGEMHHPTLAAQIASSPIGDRIIQTGYVDDDLFYQYVLAADVVSCLRFPSAGETSGVLMTALGFGRCSIITDYMGFSDFPETVAVKLSLSAGIGQELADHLRLLMADRGAILAKEEAAAAYARQHMSPDRCGEGYAKAISAAALGGVRGGVRRRAAAGRENAGARCLGKGLPCPPDMIRVHNLDTFQPVFVRRDAISTIETVTRKDGDYSYLKIGGGIRCDLAVTESFGTILKAMNEEQK